VASLSQGRTAAAQCGLFTHKSVPVIFEPPCTTFCSLLRSSLATSPTSATQNSSPLCTSTTTESRATTLNILQSLARQRKGFTFRWLINLKSSEVTLTFRWEETSTT